MPAPCKNCGGQHSYPHKNGCQFCEETRPHHHEWGYFGQRAVLERCERVMTISAGVILENPEPDTRALRDAKRYLCVVLRQKAGEHRVTRVRFDKKLNHEQFYAQDGELKKCSWVRVQAVAE